MAVLGIRHAETGEEGGDFPTAGQRCLLMSPVVFVCRGIDGKKEARHFPCSSTADHEVTARTSSRSSSVSSFTSEPANPDSPRSPSSSPHRPQTRRPRNSLRHTPQWLPLAQSPRRRRIYPPSSITPTRSPAMTTSPPRVQPSCARRLRAPDPPLLHRHYHRHHHHPPIALQPYPRSRPASSTFMPSTRVSEKTTTPLCTAAASDLSPMYRETGQRMSMLSVSIQLHTWLPARPGS